MPLPRTPLLRIAGAAMLGLLTAGCVGVPTDSYYDGGYSGGYSGGYGGGYGAGGYYPGSASVNVYQQPGVIYTAPPVGWRNYPPPPSGWREDAWRERQWRESRERDMRDRREGERRDMERRRDGERWDAERQRDAQRRDMERQREADRRAQEQRPQQRPNNPDTGPGPGRRELFDRSRHEPRPDWR